VKIVRMKMVRMKTVRILKTSPMLSLVFLLLVGFATVGAFAEEPSAGPDSPDETEILVPTLLLEVEDLRVEIVDAELPGSPPLPIPQVQVPLPGTEDAALATTVLPQPGLDPEVVDPRQPEPGESSIYTTGRLGTGNMNHILGALSLYKLGADPRFRFEFSHDGIDGYSGQESGTGFFRRDNLIDGTIAGDLGPFALELDGRFFSREEGLQEQARAADDNGEKYYSVEHRYLSGGTQAGISPTDSLNITTRLDASTVNRVLTDAEDPPRARETVLAPGLTAELSLPSLDAALRSGYDIRLLSADDADSIDPAQNLDLYGEFEYFFEPPVSLGAGAGVVWEIDEQLHVPFHLGLQGNPISQLTLRAEGGQEIHRRRYFNLWEDLPLLSVVGSDGSALRNEAEWYGELGAVYELDGPENTVEAGLRYARIENRLVLNDFVTNRFGFEQKERTLLTPSAALTARVAEHLRFRLGWEGQLLDTSVLEPTHSINAQLELQNAAGTLAAGAENRFRIYDDPVLPQLRLFGRAEAVEGIEFQLSFEDILEPLLEDGRPSLGSSVNDGRPFIEPGFRVIFSTQISL